MGQLLSSWLARATPRLRDPHVHLDAPRLLVRTRRGAAPGAIEVIIEDNGPEMPAAELSGFLGSVGERPGWRVAVESLAGGAEGGPACTRFTLHIQG